MEELILRAKDGNAEALACIIDKYKYLVMKRASEYRVPGYDFEDLVQHGYLSIIRAVHMYKLSSNSYNGYIINAINNNFAALLKGSIKHFREIPDENILNKDERYDFTIEDELIAYDEVKKLYNALDKLDPVEREILERHYINEDSFCEIACDINLEYNKTTYLRTRALKKLRGMLK